MKYLGIPVLASLLGTLVLPACEGSDLFKREDRAGAMIAGKQWGKWTYRYPDGTLQAQGEYRADKQVGRWTYYFPNGQMQWEGEFSDQRISGPSTFGYDNGQRRAAGLFVDGLEEGGWTFWTREGAPDQEGEFVAGRANGRWTYFGPGGAVVAQGYRSDGERVGLWQFWGPDGELCERRFAMPDGFEILHETWSGGTPRREGFVVAGKPTGRWVTWHENGNRRFSGDFVDGAPQGLWIAWDDQGRRLAQGRLQGGQFAGNWYVWRGDKAESLSASKLRPPAAFAGSWTADSSARSRPVEELLALWVAEASSPLGALVDQAPDADTPPPAEELLARTEEVPDIPLRAQPWTVAEEESLDYLIARYTDGAKSVRPPAGDRRYGSRRGAQQEAPKGDTERSEKFLGGTLPWTRFSTADGRIVDMDDFRGKRKVMLVVLRGFAREVCVYCVTQTEAICENVGAFHDQGTEAFVVYPGEKNRLEAFMESFKRVSKRQGEPPIGVLYDPDMRLVQRLGIESELAIPSTFVLDEEGRIRYAYVGAAIEDRPPVEDVLAAIRAMPRP